MSKNRVLITVGATLLVALAALIVNVNQVNAGKVFDQTGCHHCCPECNHCCQLDAEMGEEEKKCFEVETEVICIPRVVFPWQVGKRCFPFCGKKHRTACDACDGYGCSACVHNGAKTRKIKILKSRKYKCPKCEYTWTPVRKGCGPGACDGGCCDGGCDAVIHAAKAAPSYTEPSSQGLEPVELQR